jgi:pyruvate/2-oxoglutarate dehydrogenase complex dihydrolipoamide dehydrogenase (E3) component
MRAVKGAVTTSDADVIAVGLGAGGEFAAGRLAGAGLDVVGIESALVGGECPYWGCVPSKMIIRAANTLAEARRVGKLAGHATVQPDWPIVARRIREEATDDGDDTVAVERFTGKGGRFVRGRATVTGNRTVVAGGQEFRASRGLVLAGQRARDVQASPSMNLLVPPERRISPPQTIIGPKPLPAAARGAGPNTGHSRDLYH